MAKAIKVDPLTMMTRTMALSGCTKNMTEMEVPNPENADGMPACTAALNAIKELQNALSEYQALVQRDSEQIRNAIFDYIKADQSN